MNNQKIIDFELSNDSTTPGWLTSVIDAPNKRDLVSVAKKDIERMTATTIRTTRKTTTMATTTATTTATHGKRRRTEALYERNLTKYSLDSKPRIKLQRKDIEKNLTIISSDLTTTTTFRTIVEKIKTTTKANDSKRKATTTTSTLSPLITNLNVSIQIDSNECINAIKRVDNRI
uniref:Uncharacterized protein n=1 Tax=Glossina pallidipes TaxID=7398 RepID=A0A1B0A1B2_GLOPL